MPSLKQAVGQNIQGIICDGLNGLNDLYGMLSDRGIPTQIATEVISYGRGFACNESDSSPPDYGQPPAFTGGQCPQTEYLFSFDMLGRFPNGNETVAPAAMVGFGPATMSMTTVNGEPRVGLFTDGVLVDDRGFGAGVVATGFENVVVTVRNGGPDNCGDPPGEDPTPVDEFSETMDVVYDSPAGGQTTLEDILHSIKQVCVNQDGVKFAFEVQTPFGLICGKAGIGVDIGDLLVAENPISPSVDFDLCPSQRGDLQSVGFDEKKRLFKISEPKGFTGFTPDPSLDGTNNDEAQEDEDPVLAIFVKSARTNQSNPAGKTIFIARPGQTYPNTIINYIALARFKVAIPKEGGGFVYSYTEDIRIKSQDAYVACPAPEGAVSAEVSWEEGWSGTWEEGRAKSCCANCSEVDPRDESGNIDRCLND